MSAPQTESPDMKWMRFRAGAVDGFGSLEGDAVRVHTGDLFDRPQPTGERLALTELEWLPPCRPGKMIGLWNNFHALAEKNGWAKPAEPLYFLKAASSLAAHGQNIRVPSAYEGRVAYEGELAQYLHCASGLSSGESCL